MVVLSAQEIRRDFGTRTVIDGLSLTIDEGEAVGLVGINGSGKTTLGRLLAGADQPDEGTIVYRRGASVQYLEQVPSLVPGQTAQQTVLAGLSRWSQAKQQYETATAAIDKGTGDIATHLSQQSEAAEQIEHLGGWDMLHEADAVLGHVGIKNPNASVEELSGGEQRRVALARLLVSRPSLAILDEPTNHLDIETIAWLERYLVERFDGALVLITHDRYLLDSVVQRTLEIDNGQLYSYAGGYGDYLEAKAQRLAHAERTEANRKNFLRRELEWLRRQPKARGGKQKARIDRAQAAIDAAPTKTVETATLTATATRSGRSILDLRDLVVELGGHRLIDGLDLSLSKGDRIGVLGRNGSGKTTLLRTILGEITPLSGTVSLGKNSQVAYLDQARTGLDNDESIFDNVADNRSRVEVGTQSLEVRSYLERFAFPSHAQRQKVGSLSGGERARVALAKLLSSPGNLLMLDEPTNDLDVATLGALESMLGEYAGSCIVVTHDRYFLDRVATAILAFDGDAKITRYEGNYTTYQRLRPRQVSPTPPPAAPQKPKPAQKPKKGLTYKERKELAGIEDRIEAAEQRVAELEAKLADPATYAAGGERIRELNDQLSAARTESETLVERWETLETLRAESEPP